MSGLLTFPDSSGPVFLGPPGNLGLCMGPGPGLLKGLPDLWLSCIILNGLNILLSKYPCFLSSGDDLDSVFESRLLDAASASELRSLFDFGLRSFEGESSLEEELGPGGQ